MQLTGATSTRARSCLTPWCKKRGSHRAIRLVALQPVLDSQAGCTFELAHVCCDQRQVRGQRMCRDQQLVRSGSQTQGTQVVAESSVAGVRRRFQRKDFEGGQQQFDSPRQCCGAGLFSAVPRKRLPFRRAKSPAPTARQPRCASTVRVDPAVRGAGGASGQRGGDSSTGARLSSAGCPRRRIRDPPRSNLDLHPGDRR